MKLNTLIPIALAIIVLVLVSGCEMLDDDEAYRILEDRSNCMKKCSDIGCSISTYTVDVDWGFTSCSCEGCEPTPTTTSTTTTTIDTTTTICSPEDRVFVCDVCYCDDDFEGPIKFINSTMECCRYYCNEPPTPPTETTIDPTQFKYRQELNCSKLLDTGRCELGREEINPDWNVTETMIETINGNITLKEHTTWVNNFLQEKREECEEIQTSPTETTISSIRQCWVDCDESQDKCYESCMDGVRQLYRENPECKEPDRCYDAIDEDYCISHCYYDFSCYDFC